MAKSLVYGYNYISLPHSKSLCDADVKATYSTICDQTNTLESVFGSNIDAIYKYETQWLYWDDTATVNASYRMNKFSTISPTDGVLVKTNAATTLYLPFDEDATNVNTYANMPTDKWLLLSNNIDQSVSQISSAIPTGKTIMYILLQRNGIWNVYAPTNDTSVDSNIPRITEIKRYESFWIYLK
jgi:hypothetical protein